MRVLSWAEWLHVPDPCCTMYWPAMVLGSGRWEGDVCVFVGMCVSVCMQGLKASQHVCVHAQACACVCPLAPSLAHLCVCELPC